MKLVAKLLLRFLFNSSEARLRLERDIKDSICNGAFGQNIENLISSKKKLLFLAPFAWNPRNLKTQCAFFGLFAFVLAIYPLLFFIKVLTSPSDMLQSIGLGIIFTFMCLLGATAFLGLSLQTAIQCESNPTLANARSWLILKCWASGKRLASIGEIKSELSKLVEPVTPEEYLKIKEQSKKLGRISLTLTICHSAAWMLLTLSNSLWIKTLRENEMSGLLYIGSLFLVLAPAMVGVFLENAKKPVRVSKGNLHLLAEPTQLRPDVDEVSERYKDPSIRKRLRKNAKLLYYVGWLCAWDDKKLGTVLMTIVTFLLYLLMSFFIIPFLFRYQIYGLIFRVLTVFYAPITLYLVFKAWRNGGGKGKAMQRRNVLKCLKNGFDLERVLSNENMLESFSSCNYRKPTELATLDDFATRLYIKSLVNRTFGWTNDEDI